MDNDLTFELDKISAKNYSAISLSEIQKVLLEKMYVTPYQYEKTAHFSWHTTSAELRNFISKTFGIGFDPKEQSHHRNLLNTMIKTHKITPTKRGAKSTLNFSEYASLITSDEFIAFIAERIEYDNPVADKKKMYDELMYLQVNKYRKMNSYKTKRAQKNGLLAFVLAMTTNLNELIEDCYVVHINLANAGYDYTQFDFGEIQKTLLEITSYRFNQSNNLVYRYETETEVRSNNKEQTLRHFLQDIDRWGNNITDGSLP